MLIQPNSHRVLARKYRPIKLEQLVGQPILVQTLINAFKQDRLPHAWLLTGMRGVGKTTTARILARTLNYEREDALPGYPEMDTMGKHCEAIIASQHPDVVEIDAASHTGIDDVRTILDQLNYAPLLAKYKVYIIDEVHMLSEKAFNAFLKSLEEPPPYVKFIFATTELKKVPLTIVSRCQRFHLQRVQNDTLNAFLTQIANLEQINISPEAIHKITRVSDGSVRDALSLLDQAIAFAPSPIQPDAIQIMLGQINDKGVLDLCRNIVSQDLKQTLAEFNKFYLLGADPIETLSELLTLIHSVLLQKLNSSTNTSAHAIFDLEVLSEAVALFISVQESTLIALCDVLQHGLVDLHTSKHPYMYAELLLIKLVYMLMLPPIEGLIDQLEQSGDPTAASDDSKPNTSHLSSFRENAIRETQVALEVKGASSASAPSCALELETFEDLLVLAKARNASQVLYFLEHYVRLVSFKKGSISFALEDKDTYNCLPKLKEFLKEETGTPWEVTISNEQGDDTLAAQRLNEQQAILEEICTDTLVKATLKSFPDSKINLVTEF